MAVLFLAICTFLGWTLLFRPLTRPVTNQKFESTPQRLARGRYIVETLGACIKCHSPNNLLKPLPGTEGSGWVLPPPHDNPWKHKTVAPNITSDMETGIGLWTDDEIGRAIREGVARNGRSLNLRMPYIHYRNMGDEDLAAAVVYLRTLKPIRNPLPETELVFPVQFLVRTVPRPVTSPVVPDQSTTEKRGQYLVTVATCAECHSSHDFSGHALDSLTFAGGDVLWFGSTPATVPNITPDETGIKSVTADSFRDILRTGQYGGRKLHPLMPSDQYAGMTDTDLNDIYAYLRSVPPVKHVVDFTVAATPCRICKNRHGGGERN